jgi:hypothetical protein
VSSDTTSPSDENHGSGLWLWHGKAPLPPPPPQPASRVPQSPGPNVSALLRGGWMALPGGVALTLLAVMLRSTPPDMPVPASSAAVALEPVPSPAVARAVIPAPPFNIPAPRVEHTDIQLDQTQIPSAPAALSPARGTEHQLAKKAAPHTQARTVRKTHALATRGSPFVIHGVLTPPEPTVWHGGGY